MSSAPNKMYGRFSPLARTSRPDVEWIDIDEGHSNGQDEVDRTQWSEFLLPFMAVVTFMFVEEAGCHTFCLS